MFNQSTSAVLSDSNLALVDELRSIRETVKGLKAREATIRSKLLSELQGVEQGVTASGATVVEIDQQSRTKLDSDRLQALYKDAWADCQVETVVQVVRLPEAP